ncbi:CDGSH iron sulfur domain 2 [Tachypleus tridentatus]|uniref:CDGSH iron sulfur domain 2 n=1 Tax=Tachypleus tridentatus TaxID=6853 RepID=UPI003FD02B69
MWKDWLPVLPWVGTVTAVVLALLVSRLPEKKHVNKKIQKDCPKVVHSMDIEDLGTKTVFCRCWKSSKFPYCDGSHNEHNNETGDNVGPLIVKRKDV